MTYKDGTLKSFTKEQLIGIIRCLEHNVSVVEERNSNQYNLLMEKEKYRWHDLRKNPNDLPKSEKLVLAMDEDYFVAWYDDVTLWTDGEYVDINVIAWREIEPFEVTG